MPDAAVPEAPMKKIIIMTNNKRRRERVNNQPLQLPWPSAHTRSRPDGSSPHADDYQARNTSFFVSACKLSRTTRASERPPEGLCFWLPKTSPRLPRVVAPSRAFPGDTGILILCFAGVEEFVSHMSWFFVKPREWFTSRGDVGMSHLSKLCVWENVLWQAVKRRWAQ